MDRAVRFVESVPPHTVSLAATVALATAKHHHTSSASLCLARPQQRQSWSDSDRATQPVTCCESELNSQATQTVHGLILGSRRNRKCQNLLIHVAPSAQKHVQHLYSTPHMHLITSKDPFRLNIMQHNTNM